MILIRATFVEIPFWKTGIYSIIVYSNSDFLLSYKSLSHFSEIMKRINRMKSSLSYFWEKFEKTVQVKQATKHADKTQIYIYNSKKHANKCHVLFSLSLSSSLDFDTNEDSKSLLSFSFLSLFYTLSLFFYPAEQPCNFAIFSSLS